MSRVYDLIVIGAGLGGLTAAALASADGLDTLVIEGHYRPGGCAGDYTRKGVHIPVGATITSGFEPGGLHDLVYRRLGLRSRARPLDRAIEVHLPDRDVTLYNDAARWHGEWTRAFPGGEPAKRRFWAWVASLGGVIYRAATRLPVLPPVTAGDAAALLRSFRPEMLRLLPWLPRSVGSAFAGLFASDMSHRRFVDIQLLDATGCETGDCAAVSAAIALDLYRHGCFSVEGGLAAIAEDLAGSLTRCGGELRYFSRVCRLRRRAGLWHLGTERGEEFQARQVIANLPAWDLPQLLAARPVPPPAHEAWGAYLLTLVIDATDLPSGLHPYHQVLHEYDQRSDEGNNCFVTISRRSDKPRCALTVSTHTCAGEWWTAPSDEVAERKARLDRRLRAAAARVLPDLGERVILQEAADPRTYAHYTGRRLGLVGGVRQTVRASSFGARSIHTRWPGLYLCGDSVFPGQGSVGVTLSGINAWRMLLARKRGMILPPTLRA